MLMLKTVSFDSHNSEKHNENVFHYSVLKSSCYKLLDSGIRNMVFHLKKST